MNTFFFTLKRIIFEGGAINSVIIVMYITMIFVSIERLVYYAAISYRRKHIFEDLEKLGTKDGIKNLYNEKKAWRTRLSPSYSILREFDENIEKPAEVLNETLDRKASEIQRGMDAHLSILSLLANVAPLCGLLGTVTGLMASFDAIEKMEGIVEMGFLAGGIWTAMITTATGLVVAIPALIFLKAFESVQNRRMEDVSHICSILKEKFRTDAL